MNELLVVMEIIIYFGGLLLVKKFLGKTGIYAWIVIATCLAELATCESVELFGVSSALGTVLFASNFLATDVLRECYGEEESKKGVKFAIFGVLIYIVFAVIVPLYKPAEFSIDTCLALRTLCSLSLRITFSSAVMLIIANYADVFLYDYLYQKTSGRHLWFRNNVCTILCNCLENFGFMLGAFYGVYDFLTCIILACSTSLIEIFIALMDTPFLYLSKVVGGNEGC